MTENRNSADEPAPATGKNTIEQHDEQHEPTTPSRSDTVRFSGPVEFCQYMYDRCVEPNMTIDERLLLAAAVSRRTLELWPVLEEKYC